MAAQVLKIYTDSGLQLYHDVIIDFVRSSQFARLGDHFDMLMFSFAYFTALSWFIYYVAAPYLIKKCPKDKAQVDNPVDFNRGNLRVKWAHMILSFIHSIVVCTCGLYLYFMDVDQLSRTFETRIFGFSPIYGNLFAFSFGYFIWDLFVCVYHYKMYGLSFFIHAFMAVFGILFGFRTSHSFIYYQNRFLMFEVSTIFLDLHWFSVKLGYENSVGQLLVDIMGLLSYFFIRLIYGYRSTYRLAKDLIFWHKRGDCPISVIVLSTALVSLTHSLNAYWFFKLVRSVVGKPKEKSQKLEEKKKN